MKLGWFYNWNLTLVCCLILNFDVQFVKVYYHFYAIFAAYSPIVVQQIPPKTSQLKKKTDLGQVVQNCLQ